MENNSNTKQFTACSKPLLPDVFSLNTLFKEFYEDLKKSSKDIWWKGNNLGYNDNIYTSDDLLHDYYFSIKKSVENNKFPINNKEHFLAISYLRMKGIYSGYLIKKWSRERTEKSFFSNLGYTYRAEEIISSIFETDKSGFINENSNEQDILDLINSIENEEHKRILNLKTKHVSNLKIAKYLGYEKAELRSKVYYSRKKLFAKMKEKKILNDDVQYDDIIGRDSEKHSMSNIVDNEKNYYDDYPFTESYKEKILFILSKNDNKMDIEKLRLMLKLNEGHSLKKNHRSAVNKSIEKNIEESKCFILENILYSNG